jgi:hypothetical protein
MLKDLEIVKLNNGYYLLSTEHFAYPYAYHLKKKEILKVEAVGEVSGELFHNKGFSYKSECRKVVASTNKSLNLPQLKIENPERVFFEKQTYKIQVLFTEQGYIL